MGAAVFMFISAARAYRLCKEWPTQLVMATGKSGIALMISRFLRSLESGGIVISMHCSLAKQSRRLTTGKKLKHQCDA